MPRTKTECCVAMAIDAGSGCKSRGLIRDWIDCVVAPSSRSFLCRSNEYVMIEGPHNQSRHQSPRSSTRQPLPRSASYSQMAGSSDRRQPPRTLSSPDSIANLTRTHDDAAENSTQHNVVYTAGGIDRCAHEHTLSLLDALTFPLTPSHTCLHAYTHSQVLGLGMMIYTLTNTLTRTVKCLGWE
jgi:hypothetical protein